MEKKTYSELIKLKTFKERLDYLKLNGKIGYETFGHNRYLNQKLYASPEWKRVRNKVIARDYGNDLAMSDLPIKGRIIVHHINPLSKNDIVTNSEQIFDMENLICLSHDTHNAIHYCDDNQLKKEIIERKPGDTKLW